MKRIIILATMFFASTLAIAAGTPCEEVKAQIAKKIDANGVKAYSLDIVDKDVDEKGKKVVGTCEGGTKKILYTRR
ncbi:MAG: DUF1161 domain-containing protein [Oxalobacter sp.]|nr:MAG: DUF1161 domain-containing protein [Oxalobacter sp.]